MSCLCILSPNKDDLTIIQQVYVYVCYAIHRRVDSRALNIQGMGQTTVTLSTNNPIRSYPLSVLRTMRTITYNCSLCRTSFLRLSQVAYVIQGKAWLNITITASITSQCRQLDSKKS